MQANHPLYIHNANIGKTVPGAPTQTPTLPPSAGTGGLAGTANSGDTLTAFHLSGFPVGVKKNTKKWKGGIKHTKTTSLRRISYKSFSSSQPRRKE